MRVALFALVTMLLGGLVAQAVGQERSWNAPRILLVTAHPDDDAAFTGLVYQVTHQLGGVVDLAMVTDGSGGFRYATLAEEIYGLELTDERVARQHLPTIRKQELMAGGAIAGIQSYFFFDQLDDAYTLNPMPALTIVWDATAVRRRLVQLIQDRRYDLVVGHVPSAEVHGHHKAATILALQAVTSLPAEERPVVLGGFGCVIDGQAIAFSGLDGYPITNVASGRALAEFDRNQTFGFNDRLNFQIIGNWVIAEHKSQGVMQLNMNRFDRECYWYFDVNREEAKGTVTELFERLKVERP